MGHPVPAIDLGTALHLAFERYWHPVCTRGELDAAVGRALGVTLLGRRLAIADLAGGGVVALDDRCPHRSAALSCGSSDSQGLRCAYHGWRFGPDGRCNDIPSMPDGPIPARAAVTSYAVREAYGLVWVCLDNDAGAGPDPAEPGSAARLLPLPACPLADDRAFHVIAGTPYTWPVGGPRRVENFVDLAHFAFVHDGTLGRRDDPVPPLPDIERVGGELRFVYEPPELTVDPSAMFGRSQYRIVMPLTVSIEFDLPGGARRKLWMTASPVDEGTCRVFWMHGRDDDLDGDDAPYVAFQALVLAQDEPVVCSQSPRALPLEPGIELSVRTDKVSIEYRRWLKELAEAEIVRASTNVVGMLEAVLS